MTMNGFDMNPRVDAFILANLPATFTELHKCATDHFGEDMYRKIDARLQSLRKKGLIRFTRVHWKGLVWEQAA